MPLYHGNTKIKDLYIGNTKIGKLYHGNTLVYSSVPAQQRCKFMAINYGSYSRVIGSVNGYNWFELANTSLSSYDNVYYVKSLDMFIIQNGVGPALKVSTDGGINWTDKTAPANEYTLVYLEDEDTFLAYNDNDSTIYYSTNRMSTWNSFTATVSGVISASVYKLTYLNGNIVAIIKIINSGQTIYGIGSATSLSNLRSNGFISENIDSSKVYGGTSNEITYFNGKYIVKSDNNINTISSIGTGGTWTTTSMPSSSPLYYSWGNKLLPTSTRLIACANSNIITTRTDFTSSIEYTLQKQSNLALRSPIAHEESTIVVGGNNGKMYYILDSSLSYGASLTEVTTPYSSGFCIVHKTL